MGDIGIMGIMGATLANNCYLCATIVRPMESESNIIFERNSVEFVTVAAELCNFLEEAEGMPRARFVDTVMKILPLLYVKALLLPDDIGRMSPDEPESYVTEEVYESMRSALAGIMGDRDDYLDVFVEDMKYSDRPVTCHISEDIADIYQDIKNFVSVFRQGLNMTMNDALAICRDNFAQYWGQKLVNTLRALHEVRFQADRE